MRGPDSPFQVSCPGNVWGTCSVLGVGARQVQVTRRPQGLGTISQGPGQRLIRPAFQCFHFSSRLHRVADQPPPSGKLTSQGPGLPVDSEKKGLEDRGAGGCVSVGQESWPRSMWPLGRACCQL